MSLTEELKKLQELHERGALSDQEFGRAKAQLLDSAGTTKNDAPSRALASLNAFRRSLSNRWVAGVCGGLADATGLEPWLVRLLFALLLLFGGTGLLIYVLLWVFVPGE